MADIISVYQALIMPNLKQIQWMSTEKWPNIYFLNTKMDENGHNCTFAELYYYNLHINPLKCPAFYINSGICFLLMVLVHTEGISKMQKKFC